MRAGIIRGILLLVFMIAAPLALSCPVCASPTGIQVREGIFNDQFWRNTAVTLAPFSIFAAGVAWIFRGGRKPPGKFDESEP